MVSNDNIGCFVMMISEILAKSDHYYKVCRESGTSKPDITIRVEKIGAIG